MKFLHVIFLFFALFYNCEESKTEEEENRSDEVSQKTEVTSSNVVPSKESSAESKSEEKIARDDISSILDAPEEAKPRFGFGVLDKIMQKKAQLISRLFNWNKPAKMGKDYNLTPIIPMTPPQPPPPLSTSSTSTPTPTLTSTSPSPSPSPSPSTASQKRLIRPPSAMGGRRK